MDGDAAAVDAEQLPVGHRDDEHSPIGQPAEARRLRRHVEDPLDAAVEADGEHAVVMHVGDEEPAVVPARTFEEDEAIGEPSSVATKEGRMPDATIDGVKIHYSEAGEGEPLLLIMGYGMPGEAWLGSLPFLGGFRAIYYDNRGTGQSDRPGGPYTIVQMADDAAGLLDRLGIDDAHVYGVSMGGMIAQELALRHPEKVRSVGLGRTKCGGE